MESHGISMACVYELEFCNKLWMLNERQAITPMLLRNWQPNISVYRIKSRSAALQNGCNFVEYHWRLFFGRLILFITSWLQNVFFFCHASTQKPEWTFQYALFFQCRERSLWIHSKLNWFFFCPFLLTSTRKT